MNRTQNTFRLGVERTIDLFLTLRNPEAVRVHLGQEAFLIRSWKEHRWWIHRVRRRSWEVNELRLLSLALRPGDVFFDVGAWVGPYSLLASRLVGDQGCVFAFEPSLETRNHLMLNLDANRASNVRVVPLAISDEVGDATLVHGSTTSRNLVTRASAEGLRVRTTTLAQACSELGHRPDVIKLDVEGSEASTLRGSEEALADARSILLEFHTDQLRARGEKPTELFRALFALGNRVFFIEGKASGVPATGTELKPDRPPPGNFSLLLSPEWPEPS